MGLKLRTLPRHGPLGNSTESKKKKMKNDEIMKELRSLRQTADKACADV